MLRMMFAGVPHPPPFAREILTALSPEFAGTVMCPSGIGRDFTFIGLSIARNRGAARGLPKDRRPGRIDAP